MKHHPVLKPYLEGGSRVAYGARAITKGGINCLPKMTFPGGLLIGCDAGTLNFAKIKGLHTAMKSGMVAAETVFEALANGDEGGAELTAFSDKWQASWAFKELEESASFGPAIHKYGTVGGGAYNFLDQLLGGKLPTVHDTTPDHAALKKAAECEKIEYPKPDGKLSFDKASSVFLSNTNHEEDQPAISSSTIRICRFATTFPNTPSRQAATARRVSMRWSKATTASRSSRSTSRTACTARPATSRTRPRTSPGSHRKGEAVPTIRTCNALAGA